MIFPFYFNLEVFIEKNIDNYVEDYKSYGDALIYVYATTGPDFVTDIYLDYKNKNWIC